MERIIEWEKQFSSVELSKKLKDLEISVNTCFNWVYNKDKNKWSIFANSPLSQNLTWDNKITAYSASEILELLPHSLKINEKKYFISMDCDKHIFYEDMPLTNEIHISSSTDNFVNSCAKMLIHLIENNLLEIKK